MVLLASGLIATGAMATAWASDAIVTQRDKRFSAERIRLSPDDSLVIRNDDTRTHNIQVTHPRLTYNSGAQEPGEDVRIAFPAPDRYLVYCGIHPKMKLWVTVE